METYLKLSSGSLGGVFRLDEVHLFADLVDLLLDACHAGGVFATMVSVLLSLFCLDLFFDPSLFPSGWTFRGLSWSDDRRDGLGLGRHACGRLGLMRELWTASVVFQELASKTA